MPRQIREILASVRETGDRGRNTGAPGKYGRSGNPSHISVKKRPILMKFGTLHQILNPITVTWRKIEIFKIQDGGGRHLENLFLAITQRPIVRLHWSFVWGSKTICRRGLHDKNCKFVNPIWRTAAILKIVKSPYFSQKSSDFDEIRYTIANAVVTWPKIEFFKSSRWRRPPSWKSLFWP